MAYEKNKSIALCVTGSIAAYKAAFIASQLTQNNVNVHTIMTDSATKFISPLTFETLTNNPVICSMFDNKNAFSTEHISLSDKSDILLVAPATANILGKFANGIADDFLSTLYLSFAKPIYVAPAMNEKMLQHPAVQNNLNILKKHGVNIIEPESGYLSCGKSGKGRMASPEKIIELILNLLK